MDDRLKDMSKLSPEKRKLLELLLKEKNVDLSKTRILPQSRQVNRFPLSFAQQRMWFLDRLEPGNPMYNNPAAVSIKGPVNVEAMRKTLQALGQRHEVLRTVFDDNGGNPLQVLLDNSNLILREVDLSNLAKEEMQEALRRESSKEAQAPFDLKRGPLLRATLITTGEQEYVFLLTMHHIISDAWTLSIFIKEFAELYEGFAQGRPVELAELPIQYIDFACWQRDYLTGEVLDEQLSYWRKILHNADKAIHLPFDHARPGMQTFHGNVAHFKVNAKVKRNLEEFSRKQDVTLFMTCLAAIDLLLFRYSGQEDINVGTPIANRNRSEVEFLLGVFVNTLVMRSHVGDDPTFIQLLQRVKENALGAYAHQDIPFETLMEELKPERDMSRTPYFQVMFVMQNAPAQAVQLKDVRIEPLELHTPTAKYDLTIVLEPVADGLAGQIVYNTDLFEKETIDRLIGHLNRILATVSFHPQRHLSDFALMDEEEQRALIAALNNGKSAANKSGALIHELFAASPVQSGNGVRCGSVRLEHREIERRANQLARHLIESGVGPESIVGIYLNRSVDLIVTMLAVLKAGGVILPLDPDYPVDRIFYMLQDSNALSVITSTTLAPAFADAGVQIIDIIAKAQHIADQPAESVSNRINPENSAYIIYTSGSTGRPKGVVISHAAFAEHCLSMKKQYDLSSEDRILQFASANFDASLEQIFPALLAGAELVMRDKEVWTPQELARVIAKEKLTVVNLPTLYWNQFVQHVARADVELSCVRLLIVGGDLMHTDSLKFWQQSSLHSARLLNAYGPTEAVITATLFDSPADEFALEKGAVPIGKPTLGREIYILDPFSTIVPRGVAGELCIGGELLSRGYLHRPELTAEKFTPDPFASKSGRRLYRTGDLARLNSQGYLEFLGRVDNQVKIRGFRIELGEIEAVLKQYDGITDAVVTALDDENGDKRLAAYYVVKGSAPGVSSLRKFLNARLPEYMIPAAFMALDELPLSPGGKVDRKALPVPDQLRPDLGAQYVAPRTKTEVRLAEIMAGVLKVDKVGIYDNFFDLGGHSMLGTQIIAQVQEEFQVELPLRALFENPTVEGMAMAIAEEQALGVDEKDLENMLSELEGMSDEEIEKLLSEE